jgi:hypothetical protein
MRRILLSLFIVGAFANSGVCLAQIESEIAVESGESAIKVMPEDVQLSMQPDDGGGLHSRSKPEDF